MGLALECVTRDWNAFQATSERLPYMVVRTPRSIQITAIFTASAAAYLPLDRLVGKDHTPRR
ncbi:hypothetical protein DACRYDRAFT_24808 [Dacryopinax primogenitus]|uniref:Uncharacterized protein n=1 Tax=Dacryopinax primogenitus (strain DJM 731) TaxID=1858805 RepID=M5FNS1_DACPD|nr:uncharacterized protein DACRYDRAFT_24808 [Dacryopinax primogenitus]EJT97860.1 hypothetical protein DACRYDRAFT_24808 [Dacryopinax primogenitus]